MTRGSKPGVERGPYKLDDGSDPHGVQATILRYLAAGCYPETAANAAGIHREQLRRWLKKAAEQRKRRVRSIYTRFADAVEQAMAKHEGGLVATIAKASGETWTAAAWLLERRFPGRYEQHRTSERERRESLRADRARAAAEDAREAAARDSTGDTARTPEELDALLERLFGDRGAGRE